MERRAEGLRIEIPAKREWFLILFLAFFLGLLPFAMASEDEVQIPSLVFGVLFYFLLAGLLGWMLLGREVVTGDRRELVVERRAGPVRSRKRFARERIERLRIEPYEGLGGFFGRLDPRASFEFYGLGGGSIVFDYGARTHRFGSKLDEAESRQLVELIAKELRLTPPAPAPERPGSY